MDYQTAELCGMELTGLQKLEKEKARLARVHFEDIEPPMSQEEIAYYDEQL